MTDNPNKKTFWDKIHIDPTMLLILLALLVYSSLVIWSASGQDIGMMERKVGQIAMGLVIMVVMAQIPPRVYEGWAPYLYIFCIILLIINVLILIFRTNVHLVNYYTFSKIDRKSVV